MQPRPGPTLPLLSRLSFSLDLTHTGPKGQQYRSDIILASCIPSCGCVCASGTRGNRKPSVIEMPSCLPSSLSSFLPFLDRIYPFSLTIKCSVVLTGLSCHLRTSGSPVSLKGPGCGEGSASLSSIPEALLPMN